MKKNFRILSLIVSVLAIALIVVSCKKKTDDPEEPTPTPKPHWYSPEPGENGTVPLSVLPEILYDSVTQYFTINTGTNPPAVEGQFVSSPHGLIHSTVPNDTMQIYNDRYIAFYEHDTLVDFYGKQWDDDYNKYYNETFRGIYLLGSGENFSCYYLTEGYPNGMYAKQATIFSGTWDESLGGLGDFQVAVLLLETSGNTHLAPVNSFRVLGDIDGLARDTTWFSHKKDFNTDIEISAEDAFSMFRVK